VFDRIVDVLATTAAPVDTEADTVAIGVFDAKQIAHDVEDGALQALLDSGEAKTTFKHLAVTHAAGKRWVVIGLGDRDDFDAERARIAAAQVHGRAKELGTQVLCWELPHRLDDAQAGAFVEGTLLAAYTFRRYKPASDEPRLRTLVISDHDDRAQAVDRARIVAFAQNGARTLQDTPANDCTPAVLGEHACAVGTSHYNLAVEVHDPRELGMGAFSAVSQGSDTPPALIVMRYEPPGADGPLLGLVGKAVTHDTGGLSIKPSGSMEKMKYDMSGGAAVIEAIGAIAALKLPVRVLGVVGATENTISGHAMKPGDIFTSLNGTTIEVNNTDAEGRLVLGDCLAHAVVLGADRLVDVATLTGGIVTALGSVYAGLFGNDEAWATAVQAAGDATGEQLWRMPLHPEYAEMIEGRFAQLTNSSEARKASPITAAEFLHHFVGDVPWAHLDIAGVGWDRGKPYAAKGGSGFGVRLLVELARASAAG
jgi:leucyl aminopeptidase